jgi:hypothetical protein
MPSGVYKRPIKDYSKGKTCSTCKNTLPLTSYTFHKSGSRAGQPLAKCKACAKEYQKAWVQVLNPDAAKAINAKSYRNNISKHLTDENRAKRNAWTKLWSKNNPAYCRERTRRRKACKLKATPSWANLDAIREIYRKAIIEEKASGIKMNVDHIVPLISDYVCGLHVEANLEVKTARENISKNNRFWPDMSDVSNPELKALMKNFYAQAN